MDLVVKTEQGLVRGVAEDGIVAFKGIPYAAAPYGPLRFAAPSPAGSWDGIRDCADYGPTVLKPAYPWPYDTLLPEPVIPGEDCLNLNVWTPDPASVGLPVLVWIHGGAFANGSGAVPNCAGTAFARDGVVMVSLNYRLGVDGFLFFDDGGPANLGLRDQIAALQWVQANIAAFGGNPANVTVAGQSAGGMCVGALLSSPLARGLFRRAIPMSGAGHHAHGTDTGRLVAADLGRQLGVPATRSALAAVPLADLVAAQTRVSLEAQTQPDPARWGEIVRNLMPFEPTVDGEVLPVLPAAGLVAGAGAGVDVLTGCTVDEQLLFMVPNGLIDLVNDAILEFTAAGYGLPADALPAYRAARPDGSPGQILADLSGDWFFRVPGIRLAEAQLGTGARAWVYEFAWPSPLFDGRLGACHALDIGFAFDLLPIPGGHLLQGPTPPQALADTMHHAWVSFATTGDPGWAPYDLDDRPTMVFNAPTSAVENDPRGNLRAFWEGLR